MGNVLDNSKLFHPVSVIIPFYNAAETMDKCLGSILRCEVPNIELILVNDGSTDGSSELARKTCAKVIDLDRNRGQAYARNFGASRAKGDLLVFMDADIEILDRRTFDHITGTFQDDPSLTAISGIYSDECSGCNMLSVYKHLYMCYFWESLPKGGTDVMTSFLAIRKDAFMRVGQFNVSLRADACEDAEFGQRLLSSGARVLTDRTLKVGHLHNYRLYGFIKMEFYRSLNQALMSLTWIFSGVRKLSPPACYSLPWNFPVSIGLLFFLYLSVLFFPNSFFSGMIAVSFLIINLRFIAYVARQEGIALAFATFFLLFFDISICLIGVLSGIYNFIIRRERL